MNSEVLSDSINTYHGLLENNGVLYIEIFYLTHITILQTGISTLLLQRKLYSLFI